MEIPTRSLNEESEDGDQSLAETSPADVLVRASITHHWGGNRYLQDDPIEAGERSVKMNVASGLWYYDTGDPEWDSTLKIEAIQYKEDCGC